MKTAYLSSTAPARRTGIHDIFILTHRFGWPRALELDHLDETLDYEWLPLQYRDSSNRRDGQKPSLR